MKAGIFFSGSGPILILTSYDSLTHPRLLDKLRDKGMTKFMGYEVPLEQVQRRYGGHYDAVMNDLKQADDLRVMDFDGGRVFRSFNFSELGSMIYRES